MNAIQKSRCTAWQETRDHALAYEKWRYEVRDGDTLLGFRDWLGAHGDPMTDAEKRQWLADAGVK